MEFAGLCIIIFLIIIIIFAEGVTREKKSIERYSSYLRKSYGKQSDETISIDDMENISSYHLSLDECCENGRYFVDDITWNDLSMDSVFRTINTCQTSIGEEQLYHILRSPYLVDSDESEHFVNLMDYFNDNEEDRIKVLLILHKLGIKRKTSYTKILRYMSELTPESNVKHYVMMGLTVISFILIFIIPSIGVFAFLISMFISIGSYLSTKKNIDPFITTFNYTSRMLKTCDQLEKLNISVLDNDIRMANELRKPLRKLERDMFWISSGAVSMDNPCMLLVEYLKMMLHIDLIKFNKLVLLVNNSKNEINGIRSIIGNIDASISAAGHRYGLKYYCLPEFSSEIKYDARNLIHPLLKEPVDNSITTNGPVLLTGSNASGKSTFLKSVAIASIMSQTLGYVSATNYQSSRFKVYTSMALNDRISNGESYFVVEIKSLKRIIESINDGIPILCCIDEVLRGTNTIERIAASTQILRSFVGKSIIPFAATHDIELTELLEMDYTNYHFEEEILEHDVRFNFKLMDGKAVSRNAIKLLEVMDYDKNIVDKAESMVDSFIANQKWE